jgi:cytochrome c-type biogenesis protein
MSITSLVSSGPLLLAMPVAAAAGAVTFLSPCCLPLVPGYLSYITGMSGTAVAEGAAGTAEGDADTAAEGGEALAGTATAEAGGSGGVTTQVRKTVAGAAPAPRGRTVAGAALFVLGFSAVFSVYGLAAGGIGTLLHAHTQGLTQILGALTILLGLLFFGAFDRFMFAGRIFKPSLRPQAGLAGAPLLGVLFGVGWTPCLGPTLAAALTLSAQSGTAARGAFLAFVYGLGLGIPFLVVAALFQRLVNVLGFFKRNARTISRIGGAMLVAVGLLEVTGGWTWAISWLHTHWIADFNTPL